MFSAPVHLRCESLTNPLGIDFVKPMLSWQEDNAERNWRQTGYELLVATRPDLLAPGKADVWDSGKQASGESVGIPYAGPALESRKRYYWGVRVWDKKGHVTQSSEAAWWEMGLLKSDDWNGKWIRWRDPQESEDLDGIRWIWVPGQDARRVPAGTQAQFHLDFEVSQLPLRASLFLIARGDWKLDVNGKEAGQKQHWNEFDRRDLSGFLKPGHNSLDVSVTAIRPDFPATPVGNEFPTALAGLLKTENSDGSVTRVPSGEQWQTRASASAPWIPAALAGALDDSAFAQGQPLLLPQPAGLLRRAFTDEKQIVRARVYATALGAYQLFINGKRVAPYVLTPGFTQFEKRVQYQTYDVTGMMVQGRNSIAAVLGDGWFASGLTWKATHFGVAPPARFLAQLEVDFTDGTKDTIATDNSWKAAESPIIHDEIYAGEMYDARLEQPGWANAAFNDSSWAQAVIAPAYSGALSSQLDIPPQVVMTMKPERVTAGPPAGSYVFDMGQNMVGWVALRVKGQRGTTVRLRFAEILNPDGSIYTTNLRNADATDTYTLGGEGTETYVPSFTFHGFRYVEVTGYPGAPTLDDITGQVVSSLEGEPMATLTTSSDLVNRMWRLGIWGQRSNFLSVPTDCPQRDERLGWMADAAVFWRTGTYNFDTASFSKKWLRDVRDAQLQDGAFTNVSPNMLGNLDGAPGWGDAGVIVPWTAWLQYGDRSFIDRNWDAMERWMDFILRANPNYIRKQAVGPDFADWLAPDPSTPKDLVDTAYWALIADMMSQMARATGRDEAAQKYSETYAKIREAFQRAYVHPDGSVGPGSQTSYVVALQMKLLPPELESAAVSKLAADIEAHHDHLTTGFLGTPYLLFALANHGRLDIAYKLLLTETYPSWGYMIKKGATTWWERWNGDTGDPAMNSYNHYAFGSVVAWVYQAVVGIDTVSTGPGFHEITLQPHPDAQMTSARGEYDSAYGRISVDWKQVPGGEFTLKCTIPANATAKLLLPANTGPRVFEHGKKIKISESQVGRFVDIRSGSYEFTAR
ncbi:MAG: family 78 glycoside hydrolase catalytic domain [Acidobacteriaceae bacterium]|nr:family 78 glycoside hydrolase catalytic domain [Acidobacteriaceae bacterium]